VHGVARWQGCEGEQLGCGVTDYRCPECGTVAENVKLPRGEVMVCGNRAHGYYMPTMLLVEEPGAKSNADAFRKNLQHEVDGLYRQAAAAEQRFASGHWGGSEKTLGGSAGTAEAATAQSVEQRTCNAEDAGSSPARESEQRQPAESRPVCACGQTVWNGAQGYDGSAMCSDCSGDYAQGCFGVATEPLDVRIAAAKVETPAGDVGPWEAWSTATSEGES
jgi:hypothetical protein